MPPVPPPHVAVQAPRPLAALRAARDPALPAALLRPVTVDRRQAPIPAVLDAVARASGIGIAYPDELSAAPPVTVRRRGAPAVDVLVEALRGSGWSASLDAAGQVVVRRDAGDPREGARQPARTGSVTGRVLNAATGTPVAGAQVAVVAVPAGAAGPARATTDDDGRFTVRGVPFGVARVEVRALGYAPRAVPDVAVGAGKPAEVRVDLAPAPARLAAVDVRPAYFPTLPPPSAPVSTQTFAAEEVRRAPGAQEDVIGVLGALPGVAAPNRPGRNDLVVRGGAASENLFVVDGLEVPNLNHFGVQGSSAGAVALVPVALVRDVTVSAGGFGVRDGDRVSSVTRLELREGSRERRSGEVNLAATGLGAVAEGPLGGRATYLVSARRSYFDLLFEALDAGAVPSYTDVTVKLVARPSARDRVSLLAVGAADRFRFRAAKTDSRYDNSFVAPQQDQYIAGLTWQRTLARGGQPRGTWTTTLGRTWSRFRTAQLDTLVPAGGAAAEVFRANSTEPETSLRTEVAYQATPRLGLELGALGKSAPGSRFAVRLPGAVRADAAGVPRPLDRDTTFTATRGAAFAQAAVQLAAPLRLTLGVRADRYAFLDEAGGGATRVAPRASLTWTAGGRTTWSAAAGRYWQAPPLIWLAGDAANPRTLRPLRADHLVLGVQRLVREDLKVQVEAYAKRYGDVAARVFRPQAVLQPAARFGDVFYDIPFGLEPLASTGRGTVRGVDALVQKKLSDVPVYGVLALSASRSRFRGLDGVDRRGAYDTPVSASLLAGWRPTARWEFAARGRAASGLPYTPFDESGPRRGQLDFTRYNAGGRLPTFATLDLRADRRYTVRGRTVGAYLDVQNATARGNVSVYVWDPLTDRPLFERPITTPLPTLGVNVQF